MLRRAACRLGQRFGLHPLALEDTQEFGQRPKLDDYGDTALLVFYSVDARRRPRGGPPPRQRRLDDHRPPGRPRAAGRGDRAHHARRRPRPRRRRSTASSTRSPTRSSRSSTRARQPHRPARWTRCCSTPTPGSARGAPSPAQAGRDRAAPHRRAPARPVPGPRRRRSSDGCRASRPTTRAPAFATSATTSCRSPS